MKKKTQLCVICGEPFLGYGNNAEPVERGRCCDDCNQTVVIPTRIAEIREAKR